MADFLTKEDLQAMQQCPRRLWLQRHHPDYVPKGEPTLYRRTVDGRIVGEKAREQLGTGFLWPKSEGDKAKASEEARKLLQQEKKPAAEVPMAANGLYARADALLPDGSSYVLRETKASTFPLKNDKVTPGSPDEHHIADTAIQLWVARNSDVPVSRVELNLLNSRWRYPGGGDYSGLFRQLDVTKEADALAKEVPSLTRKASEILKGAMPETTTGKHCSDPYECPFVGHCEKLDPPGPEHPIGLLPDSAGKRLAAKLREAKGYKSILEPKPEEFTGKDADLYKRVQTAHRTGKPILEAQCGRDIEALPFPRYYFDFEGIDFPVPQWSGVRPYEQIPFQWSCHIEASPNAFEHTEFLDLTGNDPSLACIESMRARIKDDGGPIIVYYSSYERQRLAELAVRHPEHKEILAKYTNRLFDLHPLVKKNFYHPGMLGSFSIKKVLAVIAPDLKYENLDEVQEGTGAQVAYLFATKDPDVSAEDRKTIEKNLRIYCRQDTWAMVEVAYFLLGAKRPIRPVGM